MRTRSSSDGRANARSFRRALGGRSAPWHRCVVVVALVIVVGAMVAVTVAVATRAAQRKTAARMVRLDEELTVKEAETGKCGACVGEGYLFQPLGGVGGYNRRPCWRCDGTGRPPT